MTWRTDVGNGGVRTTRERAFVVEAGGIRLAEFLAGHDASASRAITEGRVFVDRRRASSGDELLAVGAVVTVRGPRHERAGITVLQRHGGLVAVAKPAGIPTEPDRHGGSDSVVRLAAAALGVHPGALHAVTRLDRTVSGVVLLAHGAAARRDCVRWRIDGRISRRYLALSTCAPDPSAGVWDNPIRQGRFQSEAARPALTRFRVVALAPAGVVPKASAVALLALFPTTGRTHQLRIHAASASAPLLGDTEYGGPGRLTLGDGSVIRLDRVALHAARIEVLVPDETPWDVSAPTPEPMELWWQQLGGDPEAWSAALEVNA
ncbi:MAG: RluA family pseudouridine synthase [Polyangiaceae bacterium]|nr:RluA family pseudouridine synthase [Polyangiaceae bacterium]